MERRKEMCSLKSNEPGAGIVLMKLDEIHRFEGHPFKVERNQELIRSDAEELLASAREDMSGYPWSDSPEGNNCQLKFVGNGQHWLHTDREAAAMRKWEQTVLKESRSIIPNK